MSKGFNNSVVLTQNSSGPKEGTTCQTESSMYGETLELANSLSAEDSIILHAAEELREMDIVPRFFGSSRDSHIGLDLLGPIEETHSMPIV